MKNYGTLFHCELSSDPKTSTLKLSRSDLNIFLNDLEELSCPGCHLIHCFLFLLNIYIYMWCKNLNESGLNFKAGFDCLVVCLGLLVPLENFFTHLETFTEKGLQILTCTRHSWPLSSESSLTCHTYCDTGKPFIKFIFKDP